MLLHPAAGGLVEPLLEEVQRHAGVEVTIPGSIGLHFVASHAPDVARWSALLTLNGTGGVSALADTMRIPLKLLEVAP